MLKRLVAILLILLLLPLGAFAAGETNDSGMPYVLDAFEGTALDLSAYEGKAVFLNFFTTWCYYCMNEMPSIRRLRDTYGEDQLAIVLVHVWSDGVEDESHTQSVKDQFDMADMTFIEDKKRSAGSHGRASRLPHEHIHRQGRLSARHGERA